MKVAIVVLLILLTVLAFWVIALYAEKKGLLKDSDNDFIPDVIEDKVQDVKDGVNDKIDNTKRKIQNVKKAIKE